MNDENDRRAEGVAPVARKAAELRRLEQVLGQPDLYRKDPATFASTTMALAAARSELTEVEEQWLAAELRREDVEGQ